MRKIICRVLEWFLAAEREVVYRVEGFGLEPKTGYDGDAGYDLYCSRNTEVPPGESTLVPSGIFVEPKARIWFEMKARSSTLHKKGLEVVDAVIDRGYRGELFSIVRNPTSAPIPILAYERVAQIVPHYLIPIKFVEGVPSESVRKQKGFGSSGR